MSASVLHAVFIGLFDLAVLIAGIVYTGLVLMSYRTDGPSFRPQINLHQPVHSVRALLVWLGVKILALTLRLGRPFFGILSEASADVGEWYLGGRDPETIAKFRSRFLA